MLLGQTQFWAHSRLQAVAAAPDILHRRVLVVVQVAVVLAHTEQVLRELSVRAIMVDSAILMMAVVAVARAQMVQITVLGELASPIVYPVHQLNMQAVAAVAVEAVQVLPMPED